MSTTTASAHPGDRRHEAAHAAPSEGSGRLDERAAMDVRNQVANRMARMSVRHATQAWRLRLSHPIAPYGVAMVFVQPDGHRAGCLAVRAATKLWLEGPETAHLPRLLFDFGERIGAGMLEQPYDIRTAVANRCDAGMAPESFYVGVGVSTLDTHTGLWEQVRRRDEGGVPDVPGRVLVVLSDGTTMVGERRGVREFNTYRIRSTHSLGRPPGDGMDPWMWATPEELRADGATGEVLGRLEVLNLVLWQADRARAVFAAQQWRRGQR